MAPFRYENVVEMTTFSGRLIDIRLIPSDHGNTLSPTTVLANLTVYTVYVVNVSALSSGGIGPARTVKARTDARGTKVYNIVNSFLISLKN